MSDPILTIRDVAEYLRVAEKTIYGLAQKRHIPSFKVGGQWRFRRADIDAWIAARSADSLGQQADSEAPAASDSDERP